MNKQNQINIIHDISLLYELSLAVGSSSELKENIHGFVQVLMARKNIDIVNVWLKSQFLHPEAENPGYDLAYSNPRFRINTEALPPDTAIASAVKNKNADSVSYLSPRFEGFVTEKGIHNGVYTVFRLGDIGFVKFYQFARRYEWSQVEMSKLEKVMDQFTQSIIGCVNHARIIEETEKRLHIEKNLREKEQELLNLVQIIHDVFWVYDHSQKKFVFASPATKDLLGLTSEELTQDAGHFKRILQTSEPDALLNRIIHSTNDLIEFSIRFSDGTERWLRSSAHTVNTPFKSKRTAGIFSDITEMKHAEQDREYRLSFEKLLLEISTAFINLPHERADEGINNALSRIGAFAGADRSYVFEFHDNDTLMSNTYEWCSENVTAEIDNLTNLPSDTFPWWIKKLSAFQSIYLPTLDALPEEAVAEKQILEAQSIRSLVVIPLASRGRLEGFIGFDFVKSYASFSDDTVKMLRFVGQMIMNMLDNRQKNDQLKRQEKRYQSIVESATDIIYRIDDQSRFIFTNEKTLEVTGFSRQELMGMDFEQIIHPNYVANVSRFYRDQYRKKIENTYLEFPIVNRFGEQLWIGQNASLNAAPGKNAELTVVARDITDLVNANASLKQAYQKAEQANQSKTQFVINTSHEIRTPVHAVGGLLSMLEGTPLNQEQKTLVKKLKSTSKSLNTLIDNVIDFKKIESDTIELKEEAFNIKDLLHMLVDMLRYTAEENKVLLHYEIDPDIEPNLIGDVGKLQRILINLTENAIKFNREGEATIKVSSRHDKSKYLVAFEVEDTGIGIDPEFLKTIQYEFDQSDNTTTRRYDGSGLGLYITLELIKMMGGKADIQSHPQKGTTVSFTLPLQKQKEQDMTVKKQPDAEESKKHFPHLNILIAEDNKINQLVASRALKSLKIKHDIAANGKEAVDMVKDTDYDAILMDLMMPEMDGFEASEAIRKELKKSMPIIACTAKKVKGTIEECYQAGMDAYITKPFNESDIRNQLNKLKM
ncbi:MAG: PAS domain S-box protein [Bacteroidota bacterium]